MSIDLAVNNTKSSVPMKVLTTTQGVETTTADVFITGVNTTDDPLNGKSLHKYVSFSYICIVIYCLHAVIITSVDFVIVYCQKY